MSSLDGTARPFGRPGDPFAGLRARPTVVGVSGKGKRMSDIDHAPELRHGSSGEWVTYLQQLLITADTDRHRWPVNVDADFGATTEKAVKAFQAWVPLPVTGVVDHETWEALYRNAQ